MDLHGGTIHASSPGLGKGSLFTVTFQRASPLPAAAAAPAAEEHISFSSGSAIRTRESLSHEAPTTFRPEWLGKHLLLVEDRLVLAELFRFCFHLCRS